jgi:hypothetical protein
MGHLRAKRDGGKELSFWLRKASKLAEKEVEELRKVP